MTENQRAEPTKMMHEMQLEMLKRSGDAPGSRYDGKPRKLNREVFGKRGRRIEVVDGEWRLVKGAHKHKSKFHSERILSRRKGGGGKKSGKPNKKGA